MEIRVERKKKMLKIKNYFTEDGYSMHTSSFKADGLKKAFNSIADMAIGYRLMNDTYIIEDERGEIIAEVRIIFHKK